ncbi:MAG: hypothetical protein J0H44_10165 [Alphaproteobacteria bacterium]|nr:hypothetical protein [Alphaproteobacteria bacterium]
MAMDAVSNVQVGIIRFEQPDALLMIALRCEMGFGNDGSNACSSMAADVAAISQESFSGTYIGEKRCKPTVLQVTLGQSHAVRNETLIQGFVPAFDGLSCSSAALPAT